jgi:hypothetical protein
MLAEMQVGAAADGSLERLSRTALERDGSLSL